MKSSPAWPPEGGHAGEDEASEEVLIPGGDASPWGGGCTRRP
ncbi:hypothetical protein QTI66_33015 [Variovorax sp. J22R133]|nr:hypothetical protein [Variovorax sp. J22R133]MDM0116950.1 hypothetical protein [Variovorax sp. J22R133]